MPSSHSATTSIARMPAGSTMWFSQVARCASKTSSPRATSTAWPWFAPACAYFTTDHRPQTTDHRPLQVFVEPADDALQAFDAAVGAAAAAQVVALFREADHLHFRFADAAELHEELLGLLHWTAPVLLALADQPAPTPVVRR